MPNYQLPLTGDGAHGHGTNVSDTVPDHLHGGATDFQGTHHHNVTGGYVNWEGGGFPVASGNPATIVQNVGLVTDNQGLHSHNIQTTLAGAHGHSFTIPGNTGQHNHFIALGGGGNILRITTMYLAVTKIIFAAPPTFQVLAPPDPLALLAAPMRGMH